MCIYLKIRVVEGKERGGDVKKSSVNWSSPQRLQGPGLGKLKPRARCVTEGIEVLVSSSTLLPGPKSLTGLEVKQLGLESALSIWDTKSFQYNTSFNFQ